MPKLAIVGNGRITKNYTSEIDRADEVIRFNALNHISKGNIGTKTTILAIRYTNIVRRFVDSEPLPVWSDTIQNCQLQHPEIWIYIKQDMRILTLRPLLRLQPPSVKLLQPGVARTGQLNPTLGCIIVHLALQEVRFKGWEIALYAFTADPIPPNQTHDMIAEQKQYRRLARRRRIKIKPRPDWVKLFRD